MSFGLEPALRMLPPALDSSAALAMLVAIALQESDLKHRRQMNGPARSYWQFEPSGVRAVMKHGASREPLQAAVARLDYPCDALVLHVACEYDLQLAALLARLLLWTVPERLPRRDEMDEGWRQYLAAWNPGKPRRERWDQRWRQAWEIVQP